MYVISVKINLTYVIVYSDSHHFASPLLPEVLASSVAFYLSKLA